MTRLMKFAALGLALLAVGSTQAEGPPQLLLHWDKGTASSRAVVKNPSGDVLAEFPWSGALPRRLSLSAEEGEYPTFLLGKLRDQLELSSQPGSDEALDFVRDLMGPHADTPVGELPSLLGTWIPYGSLDVEEWCGTVVNTYGECTEPGDPALGTTVCSNFACKRTRIQPSE